MIRVNLIRNRAQEASGNAGTQTSFQAMPSFGANSAARDMVVKVALIVLFTGALMLYEQSNIRSLNEEAGRASASLNQLQTELTAKDAEVAGFKGIEIQAKELEDKLSLLKLLSHLRLREVKTLDFVQSSIPEKVWIGEIAFAADPKHVEGGHFQFNGHAVTTDDLTEFVKRLEDSAYMMDVIVVKNQENQAGKSGTVRDFMFTAEVENKN